MPLDLDAIEKNACNCTGWDAATRIMIQDVIALVALMRALSAILDSADVPKHEDLTTRLTLLAEHDRDAYAEGHASGDKDRFARCKQDLARALGVAEDGGRDWADLLRLVGKA